MSKRLQRSLASLLIIFLISVISYSKDTWSGYFPELKGFNQLRVSPPANDVKGDSTGIEVVRVVDGDTIVVRLDGQVQKIRLIGINSPETVDPRRPVECFGKEAKKYLTELLSGKSVNLEADPSQLDKDRYNRLLRYVFLSDGILVNQMMVAEGYAYEYTHDIPYLYQEVFRRVKMDAIQTGRGLWSETTCGGKK